MKSEKLLHTMGELDDELVFGAMEMPLENGKTVRPRRVRWMILAACLCLLLVIPVMAWSDNVLFQFFPEAGRWEADTQYRFPLSAFSRDLRARAKEVGTGSANYPMDTMADAADFIGVSLPENTLLAQAEPAMMHLEFENGERMETHCLVYLGVGTKHKPIAVQVEAMYMYGEAEVDVFYSLVTEYNPYDNGGGAGVHFDERPEDDPQTYISASGRECVMAFTYTGYENFGYMGYGYVVVDGILVQLCVRHVSEETVRVMLPRLLDAYE